MTSIVFIYIQLRFGWLRLLFNLLITDNESNQQNKPVHKRPQFNVHRGETVLDKKGVLQFQRQVNQISRKDWW